MKKQIALVAHDSCKKAMVEWVKHNRSILFMHNLVATGTTGKLVEQALDEVTDGKRDFVKRLKSGPLGGDQQLGAMIAENKIDMLIFFWDPMSQQPHDVDVKALLRIAVMYNIPMACNRTSADYLISSPLFKDDTYAPIKNDYTDYLNRGVVLK